MTVAERWMDTISQNLANVSTTAYKRDVFLFNEGLDRVMNQPGGAQIGRLGSGPADKGTQTVFEMGSLAATGNPMDLAIGTERHMMQVRGGNGEIRYTRDGALALGPNRELVTKTGAQVLDPDGNPIVIPAGPFSVSADGQVQSGNQVIGRIALYDGNFQKVGDGQYISADPRLVPQNETRIHQGFIEGSNVNAIEEMVAMIKLNRAYEMAQKSIQGQDESTGRLISILTSR